MQVCRLLPSRAVAPSIPNQSLTHHLPSLPHQLPPFFQPPTPKMDNSDPFGASAEDDTMDNFSPMPDSDAALATDGGDDFFGSESAPAAAEGGGEDAGFSMPDAGFSMPDAGFTMPEAPAGMGGGEDDLFGGSEDTTATPESQDGGDSDVFGSEPSTAAPSMPPAPPPVEAPPAAPLVDAPNPMAKWHTLHQENLTTRKAADDTASTQAKVEAKSDLAEFHIAREAARESKMAKNRNEEQVKLEALEADLESINPWERVVKLIDLQVGADAPDGGEVGRMRDIMIQLKNEIKA
jgi:hypothetical protein